MVKISLKLIKALSRYRGHTHTDTSIQTHILSRYLPVVIITVLLICKNDVLTVKNNNKKFNTRLKYCYTVVKNVVLYDLYNYIKDDKTAITYGKSVK